MTDIDYAARVAKGIALLDVRWPEWATEINLDRLDIASGWHCMTAQLAQRTDMDFGWQNGMKMLDLNFVTYEEHGFKVSDDDELTKYPTLNGLWKAAILDRRSRVQDAPAEPEATA